MGTVGQVLLETGIGSIPLWAIWYCLDKAKFHEISNNLTTKVAGRLQMVTFRKFLLYSLVTVGLLIVFARVFFPSHLTVDGSESIWNVGVDNKWLLDFIRVVIGFAGVFIVVSMVVRASHGDWLSGFGPLKTSQLDRKLAGVEQDGSKFQKQIFDLTQENLIGQQKVREATVALGELTEQYAVLAQRLKECQEKGGGS